MNVYNEEGSEIDENIKVIMYCPECISKNFIYDEVRAELYCSHCGLILQGPPAEGIVYPGFLIKIFKRKLS